MRPVRARTTPDCSRISEALSRPGIDPRGWLSLAVVDVWKVDPKHGVLYDVTLLPGGTPETARDGLLYGGSGYGLFRKIPIGAEVLVAIPDGDPDSGPVIIAVLWSEADPPPADATESEVFVLQVEDTKRLLLITTGGGTVDIEARGAGQVNVTAAKVNVISSDINLGAAGLGVNQGVVQGEAIDSLTGATFQALGSPSLLVKAKKA